MATKYETRFLAMAVKDRYGSRDIKVTVHPQIREEGEEWHYVYSHNDHPLAGMSMWGFVLAEWPNENLSLRIEFESIRSLEDAKRSVSVYTKIDRRLEKLRQKYGYDFGSTLEQWLAVVCDCFGIDTVVAPSKWNPSGEMMIPAEAGGRIQSYARQLLRGEEVAL